MSLFMMGSAIASAIAAARGIQRKIVNNKMKEDVKKGSFRTGLTKWVK